MSAGNRTIVVREDTVIKGQIRNCRVIEIFGLVEGELSSETVIVHPGGRFNGVAKVLDADVRGQLEGRIAIKNLMHIAANGSVIGNVQYGRLSVEPGGLLSAEVRNVPPEIFGDLTVEVAQGRSVLITTDDLNGFDADGSADALVYSVVGVTNGYITLGGAAVPSNSFSQRDLEGGRVAFVHDGSANRRASFDVVLTDSDGATSGAPRTVAVMVGG